MYIGDFLLIKHTTFHQAYKKRKSQIKNQPKMLNLAKKGRVVKKTKTLTRERKGKVVEVRAKIKKSPILFRLLFQQFCQVNLLYFYHFRITLGSRSIRPLCSAWNEIRSFLKDVSLSIWTLTFLAINTTEHTFQMRFI